MWKKCHSLSCVQSFVTPWNVAPPGSPIHGIFQTKILEWVAISFSRNQTWVCHIVSRLYHLRHQGSPMVWKRRYNLKNLVRDTFVVSPTNFIFFYLVFALKELYSQLTNKVLQFSSVQSPSHVQLFATPQTAARQASLSITNSWSLLKLMSIESVMPFTHLILCHPLLLASILPSIRVFSNELVLCIRWPKY